MLDRTQPKPQVQAKVHTRSRRTATLLLLFLVLFSFGCQSYRDANSRTLGELTDDLAIQAAVKARLLDAPETEGLKINVEVRKGVVTLYGPANSEQARSRATEIAASVKGVNNVQNRLIVQP